MKTIILFLSILLATSCSDDNSSQASNNDILLTWRLIKYEPGFSPIDNYMDEIQWTFNNDNTVDVIIENGTVVNNSLPLNSSGNYSFSIDDDVIILNNSDSYNYKIISNELIFTKSIGTEADGIQITFQKVEN